MVSISKDGRQIRLVATSYIKSLALERYAANAVQRRQIYCLKVRV